MSVPGDRSKPMGLFAWGLGGALSLVGALCYAELASTYPRSGGDYVYLTRAFGDWCGFLFGWAQLAVILTASIGSMAFVFGDYAVGLLAGPGSALAESKGLKELWTAIFAAAAVAWVAAIVTNGILDNSFVVNAPRTPDPSTMRTVPYVVKRVVVYISEDQLELMSWLRWIQVLSGGGILVNLLLNLKWPTSSSE